MSPIRQAEGSVFSTQFDDFVTVSNTLAGAQLGAFTCFDLTINPHPTRFDFGMGKAAGMAQAGGFQ